MSNELRIPSVLDSELVRCFSSLCSLVTHDSQKLAVVFTGGLTKSYELPRDLDKLNDSGFIDENSKSIATITWNASPIIIQYYRCGRQNKSAFQDEIAVNLQANNGVDTIDEEQKGDVLRVLSSAFSGIARSEDSHGPLSWDDLFYAYEKRVDRLESLHESLLKEVSHERVAFEAERRQVAEDLNAKFEERKGELEEKLSLREQELSERETDLNSREEALEAKDNTIFRREVRRNLIEELKARSENFSLTEGTNEKRKPVSLAILSMFLLAAALTVFWTFEASVVNERTVEALDKAIVYVKVTLAALVTFSIGFYFVNWAKKWHERHAESEFRLKQFELDVERSSLVIEAALEWQREGNGVPMPEGLLTALTRNLFEYEEKEREDHMSPADSLASAILGSAASARLKSENAEVELSKRDISRLAKRKPADES